MIKCNFLEPANTYSNLSNQTKFRLNETNEFKDYFISETQERKLMSKTLSKYIAAFDYFDKTLIVLPATSGGISVISSTSIIRVPVEIASTSFILVFLLTTGIKNKVLKITRHKKKNHNKIVMLTKSKLNCIETLISQDFKTIVDEKDQDEKKKESIRMMKTSNWKNNFF